jgi:D-galactarolactone cycloisomerase
MKIAQVEAVPIKQDLKEPFGNAQGWTSARQYLIVKIRADDGTVGYGECWGPIAGNDQVVRDIIAPMVVGEDPMDTAILWEKIHFKLRWSYHSFAPYSALSGVDIALWDLKGKLMGLPISTLLGGAFRDKVLAYATGHYFRKVDTIEQLISIIQEEAKTNLAKGFRMLKLKIGLALLGWGVKEDIRLMEAFRRTIGNDNEFMVDANCAYSIPEALEVGRACERLGVYWFEEPVMPRDYDGYTFLSSKLDVPLAGGEGWALLSEFNEIFKRRAVTYAQPDVCSAGGITEVQRIAALAHAVNIDCIPHAWGTPIAIASSLHVLANKPGKALLEFDQSDNPIREKLIEEPFRLEGPYVRVPTGPGLGITIDEKMLNVFRVDR